MCNINDESRKWQLEVVSLWRSIIGPISAPTPKRQAWCKDKLLRFCSSPQQGEWAEWNSIRRCSYRRTYLQVYAGTLDKSSSTEELFWKTLLKNIGEIKRNALEQNTIWVVECILGTWKDISYCAMTQSRILPLAKKHLYTGIHTAAFLSREEILFTRNSGHLSKILTWRVSGQTWEQFHCHKKKQRANDFTTLPARWSFVNLSQPDYKIPHWDIEDLGVPNMMPKDQ